MRDMSPRLVSPSKYGHDTFSIYQLWLLSSGQAKACNGEQLRTSLLRSIPHMGKICSRRRRLRSTVKKRALGKIPSMNPTHFYRRRFSSGNPNSRAGQPSPLSFWVDIACIDQENFAIKVDEIAKSRLPYSAGHAKYFAWLAPPGGSEDLARFLATIEHLH